jgi:transcriptional regulator with XRE-family HTH domain
MNIEQIGARLDEAMRARNVRTQVKLAELSGIPQPTIARILKGGGRQGPETETLRPLAKALHVHLRWLQEGLGPRDLSDAPHNESAINGGANETQKADLSKELAEEAERLTTEMLALASEMIKTYHLASPDDRKRIDLAFSEARSNLGATDKLKVKARAR